MRQFLQVSVGPYQFLLDAEGVHEILDLVTHPAEQTGHRDWRGRVLTAVNARTLLGMQEQTLAPLHAGVVYSPGAEDAPLMLELDRVDRLLYAELHQLQRLPPLPEPVEQLFDCVLPDKGRQLYHLRRPLDILAFLAEWSTAGVPVY